jgi:hypothetical protein
MACRPRAVTAVHEAAFCSCWLQLLRACSCRYELQRHNLLPLVSICWREHSACSHPTTSPGLQVAGGAEDQ